MPLREVLRAIESAARRPIDPDAWEGGQEGSVPSWLRGRLAAVDASRPTPPSSVPDSFAVRRIIARNAVPWKGLRTTPETVAALTQRVRSARTATEFVNAARALPGIFDATGVYRGIRMSTVPVEGDAAAADLVLELDEMSYSLTTGAQQTLRGQLTATADVHVHNPLGQADSLTASIGGTSGELTLGSLSEMMSSRKGMSSTHDHGGLLSRAAAAVAPTLSLTYHKPTLFGQLMPMQLSLRSETERMDMTQGFANQVREVEATLTDASHKHSLTYSLSWRNLIPLPHPHALWHTASSPQVVHDCTASLKSSLIYSYIRDRTRGVTPVTSGTRTAFQAEVAGLGGDVQFAKAQAGWLGAISVGRYAPDTGYALPLSSAGWLAAQAGVTVQGDSNAAGPDGKRLLPHPGLAVLPWHTPPSAAPASTGVKGVTGALPAPITFLTPSPSESDLTPTARASLFLWEEHASAAATTQSTKAAPFAAAAAPAPPTPPAAPAQDGAEPYTFSHRLAGWLSPGLTLQMEVGAGAIASYGMDAGRVGGVRVADRFFLTGYRLRGYEVIGPKASKLEHGSPYGDALGGDTLMSGTARALLPPPFPSVRLANAGMRTQLYASVGRVGPVPTSVREVVDTLSASAGVGLVMPLQAGMSIEANYTVWHRAQPGDVTASIRFQLHA